MVKGTRNTPNHAQELNIKFDNNILQKVQRTKLLGIVIDENFSFNKHIEHIEHFMKKISPKIAVLHRLRYRLAIVQFILQFGEILQSRISKLFNVSKTGLHAQSLVSLTTTVLYPK